MSGILVSLIIPAYNEEKIFRDTYDSVKKYMDSHFENYEVIFVDDGSTDNTLKLARELRTAEIKVITYEKNCGKGHAIRTGMLAAQGDIIFFTDCDLAYGLDVISQGMEYFTKNPDGDILIGSRALHKEGYSGYTFLRKVASKTFLTMLKIYGGVKTSDSQSGFKAFRKKAAQKIFRLCEENRFAFDFEVILTAQRLNLKIIEMPVKIINHRASSVNLLRDSIKMFRSISKIRKNVKNKFKKILSN